MPGSHDSASVTISNWAPFSAVGLCQNVSVNEQLQRGARYLDLRVGGNKKSTLVDDTFICHGFLKGASFPDIIEEVHEFLRYNPGEFVILEVIYQKHEMSPEQQLRALQLLSSTFDQKVTHDDLNSWFKLSDLTLGQLKKSEKNVIVLVNDRMGQFSLNGTQYDSDAVAREFGCHHHNFMKNKWHNTANAHTLLESNESFLKRTCNNYDKFLNSQFVMTPQPPGGVCDVLALLVGAKSLRPVSLARELYGKDVLEAFVRDHAEDRWNIVLLDFLDLCPQLIRFLIGLNSPKHLKIEQAFVTPKDEESTLIPGKQERSQSSGLLVPISDRTIDVTKTIQKLKRRDCCLYLLDFKRDLEISMDEGTLRLKAQFDDEEPLDLQIQFDRDTEYLLCDS